MGDDSLVSDAEIGTNKAGRPPFEALHPSGGLWGNVGATLVVALATLLYLQCTKCV